MAARTLLILASICLGVSGGAAQTMQQQTTHDGVQLAMQGRFDDAREVWENVGDGAALRNLAGLFVTGVLGQPDLNAARDHFSRAAALGDAQAMLSLGYMSLNGAGTTRNAGTAEDWFRKAAARDLPEGQVMLARSILDRPADAAEIEHALTQLNAASEALHPPALMLIAELLRSGSFTEMDVEKAAEFYELAAELGAAEALGELGDMYLFAEIGAPDIPRANDYYVQASEKGVSGAMYSLAYLLYGEPDAGAETLDRAFGYARMSSLAWDERGQLLLGRMYIDGRAVPQDYEQAYFWLDLAASAGVIEAHHLRALAHAAIGDDGAEKMHAVARRWFDENHDTPHVHRLLQTSEHKFR